MSPSLLISSDSNFISSCLFSLLERSFSFFIISFTPNVNFNCLPLLPFLASGFSFTNIHDSQDNKGRGRIFLNHFHPLHRHLDISRAITAESSLLHIARGKTQTRNPWFPLSCVLFPMRVIQICHYSYRIRT